MLPVNHSSVCVQTDQTNERGTYEDPFPLLSHLTTLPLGDETTSPPTTKTSYTTSTGQSLPHIYPHISGHEPDVEAGYLYRASQDGLVSYTNKFRNQNVQQKPLNFRFKFHSFENHLNFQVDIMTIHISIITVSHHQTSCQSKGQQ